MATASVAQKPNKSFYAHLHGDSGILGQYNGQVYWFSYQDGRIVEITSYAGLVVLGEAGLADAQEMLDLCRGGYAALACRRAQEV